MAFAIKSVNLYKYLRDEKKEFGVRESVYAQSRADFNSKMYIALKEASKTAYWPELLEKTEYLTQTQSKSILDDCNELIKILSSITKSTKKIPNS